MTVRLARYLFATGCVILSTFCPTSWDVLAGDRGADEPATPPSVYGQGVRETEKRTPSEERSGFHLPTGFEAQLVAAEPRIAKPLNLAFDFKGRLWITDTVEYPYPAPADREPRDSIKVLEDRDRDGSFESVTTFAEGLNIPIGILPVEQGAICFSIPNIMLLRDTDGDGKCDDRKVLLGPFDTSRDTHGMINALRQGRDGWIYACHGFNNQSHVRAADGSEVHLTSGNTFRFRADGSHVEQFTNGQVNPFGMTRDNWGNWFTADCHSKPVTMLVRGGYYESFGRPHDGLGFVPAVMDHLHGSTAICGIQYYAAHQYPEPFRDKFYSGNVMTSRINCNRMQSDRDRIQLVEEPDFMTSDDPWFRPVDIQMGPDGALYVADFYNKIIGHYEVRLDHPDRDRDSGRIWRIVYRGSEAHEPSPGTAIVDESLLSESHLQQLTSPIPTRSDWAIERLANASLQESQWSQVKQLAAGANQADPDLRSAAIWALHRHGRDDAALLAAGLSGASPRLTVTVFQAWADQSRDDGTSNNEPSSALRQAARAALSSDIPQVALAAADVLAVHGHLDDARALLQQISYRGTDRAIVPHAMRVALKRLMQRAEIADALLSLQPQDDAQSSRQLEVLAGLLPAIDSPQAAGALLNLVRNGGARFESYRAAALQLACKHMLPEFAEGVVDLLESSSHADASNDERLSPNLDTQTSLALDAFTTLRSRQHAVPAALTSLLEEKLDRIALTILAEITPRQSAAPLAWQASSGKLWPQEDRKHQGDKGGNHKVTSSLPLGEAYVGTLSVTFECPGRLSFWLCGHDGPPNMPAGGKNFVRLVHVASDKTIVKTAPPRNDVARLVQWQLKEFEGHTVRLECVDGDSGSAYAWLAVGGFSHTGLNPSALPGLITKLTKVLEPMGHAGLTRVRPAVMSMIGSPAIGDEARARLASACAAARGLATSKFVADAAQLLGKGNLVTADIALADEPVRSQATKELAVALAAHMTLAQQTLFARGIITSAEGRQLLLDLVEDGRVAQESLRSLKELLGSGDNDPVRERLIALSQAASATPSPAEQAVISRIAGFKAVAGDYDKGKAVYEKNCANCHRLRGQGQLVGPQLDGVGPRGTERLAEDILLPNRNVDKAFRMTSILTDDDRVIVGLLRQDETGQIQLVGTDGKTQSLHPEQIATKRETSRSLMPDNFAELINDQDLSHLLKYIAP